MIPVSLEIENLIYLWSPTFFANSTVNKIWKLKDPINETITDEVLFNRLWMILVSRDASPAKKGEKKIKWLIKCSNCFCSVKFVAVRRTSDHPWYVHTNDTRNITSESTIGHTVHNIFNRFVQVEFCKIQLDHVVFELWVEFKVGGDSGKLPQTRLHKHTLTTTTMETKDVEEKKKRTNLNQVRVLLLWSHSRTYQNVGECIRTRDYGFHLQSKMGRSGRICNQSSL